MKKILIILTITLTLGSCNHKKEFEKVHEENVNSDKKFGLTEVERKQLYVENVKELEKLDAKSKAKQESLLKLNLDKAELEKEYELLNVQKRKSLESFRVGAVKMYNITEDQVEQIYFEGLNKKWPLK